MSKFMRLFVLTLSCLLLIAVLVGCGKTEVDKANEYLLTHARSEEEKYVTLNMYIPCQFDPEDDLAKDTIYAMQNEFNQIIEEKYRTRVVFKFVEEKNYASVLNEQRDYALTKAMEKLPTQDENPLDKFPACADYQMDIFVATGESMVMDFVDKNAIFKSIANEDVVLNLNDALNTTYYSKFCKESTTTSLSPVIYNNAVAKLDAENTIRYGIPANFLIGQYEYYFVKRADADKLFFMNTTGTPAERVEALEKNITAANLEIEANGSDQKPYNFNEICIVGTDKSQYPESEYYQLVKTNPQLNSADVYNGMFCIASTCRRPDRALQVINELYNNISLHSTLQYGAKEITYRLTEVDGRTVVVPVEGRPAYKINPRYTGNISMLYECNDAELSGGIALTREYLDNIYIQNLDAMLYTPPAKN